MKIYNCIKLKELDFDTQPYLDWIRDEGVETIYNINIEYQYKMLGCSAFCNTDVASIIKQLYAIMIEHDIKIFI